MSEWINVLDKLPEDFQDVLVTDGEKCWVAQTFDNIDIFLASHPDHNRYPRNEYGAPFTTHAKPTHWMPLPNPPKE